MKHICLRCVRKFLRYLLVFLKWVALCSVREKLAHKKFNVFSLVKLILVLVIIIFVCKILKICYFFSKLLLSRKLFKNFTWSFILLKEHGNFHFLRCKCYLMSIALFRERHRFLQLYRILNIKMFHQLIRIKVQQRFWEHENEMAERYKDKRIQNSWNHIHLPFQLVLLSVGLFNPILHLCATTVNFRASTMHFFLPLL